MRLRRYYLSFLTGAAAAILVLLLMDGTDSQRLLGIANAFVTVSVTLLGFMVAGLALLVSILDNPLMRRVAEMGKLPILYGEMYWCAALCFISMIFSIASLFTGNSHLIWLVAASTGVMTTAFGFMLASGYHMYNVLTRLDNTD